MSYVTGSLRHIEYAVSSSKWIQTLSNCSDREPCHLSQKTKHTKL